MQEHFRKPNLPMLRLRLSFHGCRDSSGAIGQSIPFRLLRFARRSPGRSLHPRSNPAHVEVGNTHISDVALARRHGFMGAALCHCTTSRCASDSEQNGSSSPVECVRFRRRHPASGPRNCRILLLFLRHVSHHRVSLHFRCRHDWRSACPQPRLDAESPCRLHRWHARLSGWRRYHNRRFEEPNSVKPATPKLF